MNMSRSTHFSSTRMNPMKTPATKMHPASPEVISRASTSSRTCNTAYLLPALLCILNLAVFALTGYGADTICFAAAAGGPPCAIAISPNGMVGIGNTEPTQHLQVAGNIRGELIMADLRFSLFRQDTNWGEFVIWGTNRVDPLGSPVANLEAQGERALHLNTEQEIILATRQTARLTVTQNGYVGVGTRTPGRTFEVVGNAGVKVNAHPAGNAQITFAQGGPDRAYLTYWNSSETLAMTSAIGTDGVHFHPASGNVGIGTPNPESKLDVKGKLRCEVLEVTSDRNAKTNVVRVDPEIVLRKALAMEIPEWEHLNAQGIRRLGPMAQDFFRAFGLGSDDKHISPNDMAAVSLVSLQALARRDQERSAEIARSQAEIALLREQLAELHDEVRAIREARKQPLGSTPIPQAQ